MSSTENREGRPDPDALLHTLEEKTPHGRGRLKIFFGACPGVGKTFAMLEAAKREHLAGRDVIIGYIEPHQRAETLALLEGLPALPPLAREHKGVRLPEFDLEAALKRKPDLILVDELAHTNAPGCLNEKRWQDVEHLLAEGIDVFSTLNVQHLESTNDLVAQVTGIIVRETIPDTVFDSAWEIELVDIAPDELISRLRAGKIYLPEQAERAEQSFFKKGNLVALRELALRRSTERVDNQLEDYRKAQALPSVWSMRDRLLVCVGPSPLSGKLVRATRRMAASLKCSWIAVHLDTLGRQGISSVAKERTLRNLRLAERLGAETVVLPASDMVQDLLQFAAERNISKIIVGKPSQPRWKEILSGSFVYNLTRCCGDIDIYVISGDPGESKTSFVQTAPHTPSVKGYAFSLLVVGICTALGWLVWRHVEPINLVMLYLIGVVLVSSRTSRGPSTFAAFLSVATFDVIFVPPYWNLAVSDTEYLFTFAAMLFTALLISNLTLRLRGQGEVLKEREQRTSRLFSFSKRLYSSPSEASALELACRLIGETISGKVSILLRENDGLLGRVPVLGSQFEIDDALRGVAMWTFEHDQAAGQGTETLSASLATFYPLSTQDEVLGVLGILSSKESTLWDSDRTLLLEAFVDNLASFLDRGQLAKKAEEARLETETERLRNTLLSAVSHDLRTPLAVIEGASSTLLESKDSLEIETQNSLLETIVSETEYLNRLVGNLLDASRLEGRNMKLSREWQSVEEMIGAVLSRMRRVLGKRRIETRIAPDLPLLLADGTLLHQVLANVLENAIKFSPDGSMIQMEANLRGEMVEIAIRDEGRGIEESDLPHLFDKFYRGRSGEGRSGAGLGLAVSRAIVELHGGKISAENRAGGGAAFRICLPCEKEQPEILAEGTRDYE